MIIQRLQPFKKLESAHVHLLAQDGNFFWVSQSYDRAIHESDHTIMPILFTAYKDLKDASRHYNEIRSNRFAVIMDIRERKISGKILNMTTGNSDKTPYITLVGNSMYLNNYLRRHYYEQYRSWIRKHRPDWIIREHNAVEPHYMTIYGEPAMKITWGIHSAILLLEELEKM